MGVQDKYLQILDLQRLASLRDELVTKKFIVLSLIFKKRSFN